MKLNSIASNMTEVTFNLKSKRLDGEGENTVSILFSYKTPVAGWDEQGAFRTGQHYSSTTTKHINKYFGSKDIGRTVAQSYINELTT